MTAIEKSIQDTLKAHSEYLAVLDARWRERVASKFADTSDDSDDQSVVRHNPESPVVLEV
ncbi:hypothetical protein IPV08_10755 [Methylobacterium sp. SD274]|uniref:hypothetical protein n=1 Tax=Methylobacterium sp. SD274 TaxID=2782009 RepID=UPI001A957B04|nr:hypothetical protein [Methylobacterium sp. SD274]MBO1020448.1 hypothetical protein [Methylobacterium sp. SD274]